MSCFTSDNISNATQGYFTQGEDYDATVVGQMDEGDFGFKGINAGIGINITETDDDITITATGIVENISLQSAYNGGNTITTTDPVIIQGSAGIDQALGNSYHQHFIGESVVPANGTMLTIPISDVMYIIVRFVGYSSATESTAGSIYIKYDSSASPPVAQTLDIISDSGTVVEAVLAGDININIVGPSHNISYFVDLYNKFRP